MKAKEFFEEPAETNKITILAFIIGNAVAVMAFIAPFALYILAKEI